MGKYHFLVINDHLWVWGRPQYRWTNPSKKSRQGSDPPSRQCLDFGNKWPGIPSLSHCLFWNVSLRSCNSVKYPGLMSFLLGECTAPFRLVMHCLHRNELNYFCPVRLGDEGRGILVAFLFPLRFVFGLSACQRKDGMQEKERESITGRPWIPERSMVLRMVTMFRLALSPPATDHVSKANVGLLAHE